MKRIGGNIYEEIVSIENLIAADIFARKDKDCTGVIARWDKNWANNIARLNAELREMVYQPSGYFTFSTSRADKSAKVRQISVCREYRDRIVHHAVIQVLSKYFISKFTADTYATIPGKGPHKAIGSIKELMRKRSVLHCLKMDVRKFYPSINGQIMMRVLSRIVKCRKTTWLLGQIINSSTDMPIGNLTSQWFGNLYLCELDHFAKETLKATSYYRYCDDIVIIEDSRDRLMEMAIAIKEWLKRERNLEVKPSLTIFRIGENKTNGRGIDFLGYVFYRRHTALRKSTKVRWRRKLKALNKAPATDYDVQMAGSLKGITKHCNSRNLIKTFKNDYPEYFNRLQQREAASRTAARLRAREVATVLQSGTDASCGGKPVGAMAG